MSRRRWVYTQGGRPLAEPIEVTSDWSDAPAVHAPVTDLYMDGTRATDGADIGSRAKRRAYMKANGLADADDYRETWAKAAKEREQAAREGFKDSTRRADVARAIETVRRGRR